ALSSPLGAAATEGTRAVVSAVRGDGRSGITGRALLERSVVTGGRVRHVQPQRRRRGRCDVLHGFFTPNVPIDTPSLRSSATTRCQGWKRYPMPGSVRRCCG